MSLTSNTETWLGFDNVLHRAVAVSMPRPERFRDRVFLDQFLQRSQIATALHHRGIIAAFDSGEDGGTPYLVTEYFAGDTLTDIIRAESPFDVEDVAVLIGQLGNALDYAHQRGFGHGALTSEHVIVDRQGAAKVVGLGLPAGTFLSDAERSVSLDGDIRSLGAIAYEMLTGEAADETQGSWKGDAYLAAPEVPRNASDIIAIALGAGPVRFSSAGAFARSLSGWRNFDPGAYFPPPASPIEKTGAGGQFNTGLSITPPPLPEMGPIGRETVPSGADQQAAPDRRNLWAAGAAVLLSIVAVALVWHGSSPSTGQVPALPAQLTQLARLGGF